MRNDRTIHIPHNKLIDFQKAKASNLFERDPESLSDDELELKRDLELVVLPAIMSPSMDTPINEDTTIADVIPAKGIVEINDEHNASERSQMLKRCLNRLNDIQRVCVVLNKGLCGHEEQSLRQIADRIGISHTKVGEHVKKGVESLKVIMFEHEDLSIYTHEHGSNWTF
jgi:DNA-directed RNA polymerase sigma subunit (sigma70/sigma32)